MRRDEDKLRNVHNYVKRVNNEKWETKEEAEMLRSPVERG